jgi:hypothetical protein
MRALHGRGPFSRRVALAVVLAGTIGAVSMPARAASDPFSWSNPALVDPLSPDSKFIGHEIPIALASCPSVSLCVAQDVRGNLFSSHKPTGGPSAWTMSPGPGAAVPCPSLLCAPPTAISCPSDSLCIAVDRQGNIYTTSDPAAGPEAWTETQTGPANWTGAATKVTVELACPSAQLCVAFDDDGSVLTIDPTAGPDAWAVTPGVDPPSHIGLGGLSLSCPSATLCVAVDGAGNALTSTDPAGGASAWKLAKIDLVDNGLKAVSCPSPSLCIAVDFDSVITSTNPTGGAGAWKRVRLTSDAYAAFDDVSCASVSFCVAVGGPLAVTQDPTGGASAWKIGGGLGVSRLACPSPAMCVGTDFFGQRGTVLTTTSPNRVDRDWTWTLLEAANGLGPIHCQSTSLCVAFDDAGNVVTTNSLTPGAPWTAVHLWAGPYSDDTGLRDEVTALSCPTPSLCVASNTSGYVFKSTNPKGGRGAWKTVGVPVTNYLNDISCPSASLCVAVAGDGRVAVSTHPSRRRRAWVAHKVDRAALGSISCPTRRFCVAGDEQGNILTSSHPTGGARSWKKRHIHGPQGRGGRLYQLNDIVCPSVSLCLAVTEDGDVLASTHPARGPWQATPIDPTDCPSCASAPAKLGSIACGSPSLCVVLDGDAVVTSTDPAGGAQAWTRTTIDQLSDLDDVSCPSPSLCVVVDSDGNVVIGRAPPRAD